MCLGSTAISMVCNTYSLSSLPSPTNASFASSMAQEISLFRKSLQEKSFLIKKPCNIIMTIASGELGKTTYCCTGQLWCSGTVSPGRSQKSFIKLSLSEDEYPISEMQGKIELFKISAADRTTNKFCSTTS